MQGRRGLRRELDRLRVGLVALVVALAATRATAAPLDDLASNDPHAVEAAIAAIEHGPLDADMMFAAARACEDRLYDPARAAGLYERIARELPDARVAIPARRRSEQLRAQLGAGDAYATQARSLARLVAEADTRELDDVVVRAEKLVDEPWPGAPDAELWLAEWLRERGRYQAALHDYTDLMKRWPSSPQAIEAARDAAGCALDAHEWDLAAQLAERLPGGNAVEDAAREELLAAAKRGRRRDTISTAATAAMMLAFGLLLASLADAIRRGGTRWPRVRPPLEVMFLGPIAGVLAALAWLTQRTIAPAVTRISIAGVVLAWLSGATLDLMRARGRASRARSLVHIAACALGVLACAYLAIDKDGLLDMLAETARYGPEP